MASFPTSPTCFKDPECEGFVGFLNHECLETMHLPHRQSKVPVERNPGKRTSDPYGNLHQ